MILLSVICMLGKKAVDVFTTLLMDTGARAQKINMKFVTCGCINWIMSFVKCYTVYIDIDFNLAIT